MACVQCRIIGRFTGSGAGRGGLWPAAAIRSAACLIAVPASSVVITPPRSPGDPRQAEPRVNSTQPSSLGRTCARSATAHHPKLAHVICTVCQRSARPLRSAHLPPYRWLRRTSAPLIRPRLILWPWRRPCHHRCARFRRNGGGTADVCHDNEEREWQRREQVPPRPRARPPRPSSARRPSASAVSAFWTPP